MNIIWLDDSGCQDVPRGGGKVANLSRLAAEYQVPSGFCLTTAAFQEWAGHGDGRTDEVPPELLGQLGDAYGEMAKRANTEQPSVAVRSSAIDEDIFFLQTGEIAAAATSSPAPDHTGLVDERKKELEHFASLQPPLFMGTDYGPPPPGLVSLAFGKFFGTPPEPSEAEDTLTGNAGSPGKVQGTARVVRSLDEAAKLQKGDILVAETTAPPWTPLFATAAAIVTDTGGILSHCAVVAQEYRIPAVVGTGVATSTIKDGQTIEVDGDAGRVRIVD